MGDGWGDDGAGRWDGRLRITLGEQGWLGFTASEEAGQVKVQQFQFIMRDKILRTVREMKDILLTMKK